MPSAQTTKLFSEAIRAAIPDGALTVSDWAPTYRVLSPERTNPERAGKWRNEYVPHLIPVMDWFTEPDCEEIVLVASSQIGKTELVNNCVGYAIHIDPGPILYLAEDEGKGKAWKQECFDLMVRDSDVLRDLVADGRGRKSENTQTGATFPGGRLNIAWATSPATVSSRPVRWLFIDERDAMGPSKEGDSPFVANKRLTTFKGSKKKLIISSPRNRLENPPELPPDTPRRTYIEQEYHATDRNKRWIPCPHCGEFQVLAFFAERCSCPPGDDPCELQHGHVDWEPGDPASAYYVCFNGCEISEEERMDALQRGEMRPEAPYYGKHGLWINELYSTFSSLADIAKAYVEAKADPSGEKMKGFLNTTLAEGYQEREGEIDTDDLVELQETYDREVIPEEILILVASVDVQKDRLELEIKGYGIGDRSKPNAATVPQSWGIDYFQIDGDPAGPTVWDELKESLGAVYTTPSGRQLRISATAIDTGYLAHRVYRFVRQNRGRRIFAVRGANTPGKPLISKPTKVGDPPVRLWTIGTETAKDSIANRLELKDKTQPGFCHFGKHYPEHYFRQLRAEQPVVRYHRGRAFRCWEKIKDWYRNEALDLFVYCDAVLAIALRLLKTNFLTLARKADEERERLGAEALGPVQGPTIPEEPEPDPSDDTDDDDHDDEIKITIGRRRGGLLGKRSGGSFVTG